MTRRIGLLGFVVLTQSSIYKEYLDLMDTEAWKEYIILKIYKLQQIFRPRIIYIYIYRDDKTKSLKLNTQTMLTINMGLKYCIKNKDNIPLIYIG